MTPTEIKEIINIHNDFAIECMRRHNEAITHSLQIAAYTETRRTQEQNARYESLIVELRRRIQEYMAKEQNWQRL